MAGEWWNPFSSGSGAESAPSAIQQRQDIAPHWLVLLTILVILLFGVAGHALVAKVTMYPARYAAVALFGFLAGAAELISRYRERPTAPLRTWPGLIYIGTNIVAGIGALWLLQQKGVSFSFGS